MRLLTEADAPMRYRLIETPIGAVGVAWTERGLARLQLPERDRSATERRLCGRAARRVGWGETTTYGALARLAGFPDAARAVGQAMGRNPLPIIIPCHRVLAAGRRAGGFSSFGGADTKRRLLALEGVLLGDDAPLLPGLLGAGR